MPGVHVVRKPQLSAGRRSGLVRRALWAKLMSLELLPRAAGTTEGFQTRKPHDQICMEGRFLGRVDGSGWGHGVEERECHVLFEAGWWESGMAGHGE